MAVNKAGAQVATFQVNGLPGFVLAKADNASLVDGHIGRMDLG